MRISFEDYMMGRDQDFPRECTEDVMRHASHTIERVNQLLVVMEAQGLPLEQSPRTGSLVNSGWRPAAVNAGIANAAPRSKHMSGEACDLYDPEGVLDDWCMEHQDALAALGLWLEHPSATKGWCHLQIVPPKSGRRVFYP